MTSANITSVKRACRAERRACLFFLLWTVLLSIFTFNSTFAGDSTYLNGLLNTARESRLFDDRYWQALLHYKRSGAGYKSLVDDPRFFLAPDGKINPLTELEASLRGFFLMEPAGDDHPRCRFPARFAWLSERLSIDDSRLPQVSCAKLHEALELINPKKATLVFPAAHGNGPASMFGHTLIRIDGGYESDLISYAVNYAANATDMNGLVYAFKGIFGYYKGYYSILPYYEKVKEYNDMEHRDIWEYPLNLSEDEVRGMTLHIWELRDIYSDYYFFDENCSYDLLFLLEAARPSVDLTGRWDGLKFWVIPSDTVRAVIETGMTNSVKYRPSLASRIRAIASRMDDALQNTALDVVYGKADPRSINETSLAKEDKIKSLDLSSELLQYGLSRKNIEKPNFQKQFIAILSARSAFGKHDDNAYSIVPPVHPENGHLPGKLGILFGYRDDSSFAELSWRPAYHDLMDPDEGYVRGAQINFLSVRGRSYFEENTVRLESLRFVDIVSIAPRNRFFKPVSWKVNAGLDSEIMPDGKDRLIYRINSGGGLAYENGLFGLSFIMLEADLVAGSYLKNSYSIGIGPSGGIIKNMTNRWKISLSAQGTQYFLGDMRRSFKLSLAQNYTITANNSVFLALSRESAFDRDRDEMRLGWSLYF